MRQLGIIISILFSFVSKAQEPLVGRYKKIYLGEEIDVRNDSTFYYTWNGHMQSSWTKGTWTMKKDTIFFQMIGVYDTVSVKSITSTTQDSLVISLDTLPNRTVLRKDVLYAYGQNYRSYPKKLVWRKGRLYEINANGTLINRKVRGFMTNKRIAVWYQKLGH
jgi:hypothetical protein